MKPLKQTHILKPVEGTRMTFCVVFLAGETFPRKFASLDEAVAYAKKASPARIVIE